MCAFYYYKGVFFPALLLALEVFSFVRNGSNRGAPRDLAAIGVEKNLNGLRLYDGKSVIRASFHTVVVVVVVRKLNSVVHYHHVYYNALTAINRWHVLLWISSTYTFLHPPASK